MSEATEHGPHGQQDVVRPPRRFLLALAVFLTGTAAFILIATLLWSVERQRLQARFELAARDRVQAIDREIETTLEALRSVQAFYNASELVERHEFAAFTQTLLQHHRQILAIEWVPRVPGPQRADYEAQARADGLSGFTISDLGPDGVTPIPAAARSEYFPVYYAQPQSINRRVLGVDLWSQPARRQAMQQAWQDKRMAASVAVPLMQDGATHGLLMCLPVFAAASATGDPAPEQLRGFIVAVLRFADLVEDAMRRLDPQPIGLLVYTADGEGRQVLTVHQWQAGQDAEPQHARLLEHRDVLDLGGRPLQITCVAGRNFAALAYTAQPLWVLVIGLVLSATTAGYVCSHQGRHDAVQRLVSERTEQLHQSRLDLHHEKQLLHAIIENVGEGIVVADVRGHYILRNGAAVRLMGPARPGLNQQAWAEHYGLFATDGVTPLASEQLPLTRAVRGESVDDQEIFLRNEHQPQGLWLSVTGRPVRDEHGQLHGGVVVIRDVTQRRENERRIRAMNLELERRVQARTAELERSNEELQQFAFIASHDLKEPLRKVRMFGDRIKEKYSHSLDPRAVDYLQRMQAASARMENLLNALLAYSRVTTKGQPIGEVPLDEVLREVVSDLELSVQESQAIIEIGALPTVSGDRPQIRQLFQNLIANAIKYQKPGRQPVVHVTGATLPMDETGQQVCRVVVCDEGIGFDNQYARRIFGPFQRLHGQNEFAGTGMGLAICRKIVDRHGGQIMADGKPGVGATFTVELPAWPQPRST
jgi:PAS domain S-box-containing protein